DHHSRSKVVVDAELVLLPPDRHVDGSGKGRQIQGGRIDAPDVDIAVAIDELQLLEEAVGKVPRPVGDLAIKSLAADIAGAERPGLLISHAVLETRVPVALVVV